MVGFRCEAPECVQSLLKKYGFLPETVVTDDLRPYHAAARDLGIEHRHRAGRWRQQGGQFASTDPTTRTQDARFQEPGAAQRFFSIHATIYKTFNVQRHLISARTNRAFRASVMQTWYEAVAAGVISATRNFLIKYPIM
jgi:transposase-like protein